MFFCRQGQHTLPMGLAEDLRAAQVKIFCPKCEQAGWQPSLHNRFGMRHASTDQPQVYAAKSKYRELDGAFFGMSSCHVFRTAFVSQWLSIGTLKVLSDWCFSELVDLHIEIFINIPSSVESVHILFMPSSDSLAVVSLLHAFH